MKMSGVFREIYSDRRSNLCYAFTNDIFLNILGNWISDSAQKKKWKMDKRLVFLILLSKYRRISCDVFVLISMYDGPVFWKQKMEALNRKTEIIKERKRKTKEEKTTTSFVALSCYLKKYLVFLLLLQTGVKYFEESIFLAHRSAAFCFLSFLMASELHVSKRALWKHWNTSMEIIKNIFRYLNSRYWIFKYYFIWTHTLYSLLDSKSFDTFFSYIS